MPRRTTFRECSVRLYRWLLRAYPAGFRGDYSTEMVQVFGDLCHYAERRNGMIGLICVWKTVLSDLLVSATIERMREMSRKLTPATLAAVVLLLPTMVFLTIMFTRFVLGIEGLYNAWDRFYLNPGLSALNWTLERFMVLAPFAALALAAIPVTRIQLGRDEGSMVASVNIRLKPVTAAVILLALLVIAVIIGYGFVENFQRI